MACVRRSVARANTCRLALLLAQRSLEQMVNLLEEYESAKSVPGSLESFDLKGDRGGSNPPSSSGESRANQTSGAHFSTPPIMSSASACVWLGAVISQKATVWRSRPGAEPAGRAREDPRLAGSARPSRDRQRTGELKGREDAARSCGSDSARIATNLGPVLDASPLHPELRGKLQKSSGKHRLHAWPMRFVNLSNTKARARSPLFGANNVH